MSLTEKVDVIDFIITILREHEKKLSELIDKLEGATPYLGSCPKCGSTLTMKTYEEDEALEPFCEKCQLFWLSVEAMEEASS